VVVGGTRECETRCDTSNPRPPHANELLISRRLKVIVALTVPEILAEHIARKLV
jgi:hypothetical protein